MAGYATRQSTYTTGDVIAEADSNDEFNQLLAAFNATTGHTHDGTAGDGGPVGAIRDSGNLNRVLIDDSNNHLEFYVNVSSSSVQQLRIEDGAIVPVTDNDIDLVTSLLEFKDLHLDGTANIDSLVADTADINAGTVDAVIGGTTPAAGTFTTLTANTSLALASGATVTAINDEDTMSSDSATALATQQSIKAYVDTEIAALPIGDITAVNAGTGLSGGGTTGDVTLSIDTGTTVDLSTAQILTNKTLTAPVISTISNTGTLTLPTSTDTLVGRATTDTLTNKTIDANGTGNSITNLEVADFAGSVIVLESEGISSNDNDTTLPTSAAVKDYVDTQVATANELSELTDVNITSPADASLLFYDTGTSTWIDNVVSVDITIADTGVAAISSGVIVNADINASAAISVSKTALVDGTGLTLTGDTLSVDASQTQITAVGTIATGTWQGTAIADAYVADNLTISGGTVDNSVI